MIAYNDLKLQLTWAPILGYPNPSLPYELHTDACKAGLGAMLCQRDTADRLRVIGYAARKLSKSKGNYTITQMECLGVVWAVRMYRPYLYGLDHFTIVTDHSALTSLIDKNPLEDVHAQMQRWILTLNEYRFTTVHRPGASHHVPDALSRTTPATFEYAFDGLSPFQAEQPPLSDTYKLLTLHPDGSATLGHAPRLPEYHPEREPLPTPTHSGVDTSQPILSNDPAESGGAHGPSEGKPQGIYSAAEPGLILYSIAELQARDPELGPIVAYLKDALLPQEPNQAQLVVAWATQFRLDEANVLFYNDVAKQAHSPAGRLGVS